MPSDIFISSELTKNIKNLLLEEYSDYWRKVNGKTEGFPEEVEITKNALTYIFEELEL